MEVVTEVPASDLKDSIFVTGFRGFGMVGYMVSKHLALALGAEKIGYVIADKTPPVIFIEEDGVGFPFELYYSKGAKALILVNRAIPDRDHIDEFTRGLVKWLSSIKPKYSILVGGLSKDLKPANEKYGYRWISNKYYTSVGPPLEAPLMGPGLEVVGPLASLYMYMTHYKIPAIMLLPFSIVEGIDYDAAIVGIRVIAEKLLGVKVEITALEQLAVSQRVEMERMLKRIMEEREEEEGEKRGEIYM